MGVCLAALPIQFLVSVLLAFFRGKSHPTREGSGATNAPWRIELMCRMAVAFVEATPQLRESVESVVRGSKFWPVGCDSPWGEIIRPAFKELPLAHPTKKPVVPFTDFVDILCDVDPDLRPLIERQSNFMRTRWAVHVEHAS